MYNRYTPNTQGGFRRQTVPQEREKPGAPAPQTRNQAQSGPGARETSGPGGGERPKADRAAPQPRRETPPQTQSAPPVPRETVPTCSGDGGNFLSGLLARFDRGDILVLLILLLLLMEGNEDSTTVVMTLAIYLMLQ